VISDILGKTGMGMVKAIIAGERNPEILYKLCDPRIKASREDIIKSLDGIWKDEYLFMLEQAVETYEFHKKQVKTCEEKIQQQLLKQVALIKDGDITGLEETQKKKSKANSKKNQFDFSLLPYLIALAGVDLCKIPGISQVTALEFTAEVGLDMSKWKSPKHFAAWLNLTPNTKISGGKILSSKMMKKNNKAGQLLRQAASCLVTNKTPIGDYYRSMRARMGGKGAALATAHKLARIIYTMLLKQTQYNPGMIIENHEKSKEEKIKKLEKQIARLKQVA
jgi:hypothetical protein